MTRTLLLAPLALLLAGAVFLALSLSDARERDRVAGDVVGAQIPDVRLPTLDGETFFVAPTAAGEPYVLNVFASWCTPCRAEHPFLMQLAENGAPLYGVAWKDAAVDAQGFLDELGDPYRRIGHDLEGRFGKRLGVEGAPETFVVSPEGTVLAHHRGPITAQTWARRLAPALAAAQSAAGS